MGNRDNEKIVVLTEIPNRLQAEAIAATLEANGIKATVAHGDIGGWAPSMADGSRVLVFEGDVDAAQAILDEAE